MLGIFFCEGENTLVHTPHPTPTKKKMEDMYTNVLRVMREFHRVDPDKFVECQNGMDQGLGIHHMAGCAGSEKILEFLLTVPGIIVDEPDETYDMATPLHVAVEKCIPTNVEVYLKSGRVNIHAKLKCGDTPLVHLILRVPYQRKNHTSTILMLLKYGADTYKHSDLRIRMNRVVTRVRVLLALSTSREMSRTTILLPVHLRILDKMLCEKDHLLEYRVEYKSVYDDDDA